MDFVQSIARQAEIINSISNAPANLKKVGVANYTHTVLTTRINSLEKNWNEFTDNHRHLCTLRDTDNAQNEYFTANTYSKTEEDYLVALAYHYSCLESLPRPATAPSAIGVGLPAATTVKQLPRINLPQFSGKFTDWADFRDLFVSMVTSNPNLTNVERLHYLKTSMTGDASQLLKNLATIGENFERAWTILTSRFENKRLLVSSHLNALTSLRVITTESASEIKRLINGTTSSREALEQLGRTVNQWDDLLVHLTVQKLDSSTRRVWETLIGAKTEYPTFQELQTFLDTRINTLEALGATQTSTRSSNQSDSSRNSKKSHHVSGTRESACARCSSSHFILHCPDFRAKTPEQRREVVNNKNLCFKCLGFHRGADCRSTKRCLQCSAQHHTMLHLTTASTAPTGANAHVAVAPNTTLPQNACVSAPNAFARQVLLATAVVYIHDIDGNRHLARALIDQGSEVSFIASTLTHKLHLARRPVSVPIAGVGGASVASAREQTTVQLSSRHNSTSTCRVDALILRTPTNYRTPICTIRPEWHHLQGLELADSYAYDGTIELILGADIYSTLLLDGIRRGPAETPLAQQTIFGCVLSGPISTPHAPPPSQKKVVHSAHLYIDHTPLLYTAALTAGGITRLNSSFRHSMRRAECSRQSRYSPSKRASWTIVPPTCMPASSENGRVALATVARARFTA